MIDLDGQIIQLPQNLSSNIVTMTVSEPMSFSRIDILGFRHHKVFNNNIPLVNKDENLRLVLFVLRHWILSFCKYLCISISINSKKNLIHSID